MKKLYLSGASLLAFCLCLIGPANAVPMELTFNGVVNKSAGFDAFNTFGTGGSLTGQSFSMSFSYNANPGDTTLTGHTPANMVATSLTINGVKFSMQKGVDGVPDFGPGGYALRNDSFSVLTAWADVTYSNASSAFNRVGFYAGTILGTLFSADLTTPFNVSGINCFDCGSFIAYRVSPGGTDYFMGGIDISAASLSVVPVPAALPLLATALAGLGITAARRRRRDRAHL